VDKFLILLCFSAFSFSSVLAAIVAVIDDVKSLDYSLHDPCTATCQRVFCNCVQRLCHCDITLTIVSRDVVGGVVEGKGKGRETCCSAPYTSQTRAQQQRFNNNNNNNRFV